MKMTMNDGDNSITCNSHRMGNGKQIINERINCRYNLRARHNLATDIKLTPQQIITNELIDNRIQIAQILYSLIDSLDCIQNSWIGSMLNICNGCLMHDPKQIICNRLRTQIRRKKKREMNNENWFLSLFSIFLWFIFMFIQTKRLKWFSIFFWQLTAPNAFQSHELINYPDLFHSISSSPFFHFWIKDCVKNNNRTKKIRCNKLYIWCVCSFCIPKREREKKNRSLLLFLSNIKTDIEYPNCYLLVLVCHYCMSFPNTMRNFCLLRSVCVCSTGFSVHWKLDKSVTIW